MFSCVNELRMSFNVTIAFVLIRVATRDVSDDDVKGFV